jgi:glycine/D-amino acid oxidase-like deaminating enzyme
MISNNDLPAHASVIVIGAVWSPVDGRVGPSDLCAALVKGAKSRGGYRPQLLLWYYLAHSSV